MEHRIWPREVNIAERLSNSDNDVIKFNILGGGEMPKKPTTIAFNFKTGNYTKMRKLVRWQLKGTVTSGKCLQTAWRLFKSTITEAVKGPKKFHHA